MSVKQKLTLLIAGILVILLSAHMLHLWTTSNRNLEEQAARYLNDVASKMANEQTLQDYSRSLGTDNRFVFEDVLEIGAFRISENQVSLAYGTYAHLSDGEEMKTVRLAAEGRTYNRDMTLQDGTHALIHYARLARADAMVLRIAYDLTSAEQVVTKQLEQQLALSGIMLLTLTLTAYLLLGRIFRPLDQIIWKIRKVSNAQFDDMLPVKGRDEFAQLAEQMNNMSKNISVYMGKLKAAFEDNRSMKHHLESFINHTTDAIHVVDLEGKTMSINQAFTKMFGYTEHEALGRWLPLVPPNWRTEAQKAAEAVIAGKVLAPMETTRETKSGEWLSVSVTTSPIRDGNGSVRAIASITRDMTSRNKMEELLRRSEKLTTVGQLAAGVAHEIRNPLTTLKGFLQLQMQTKRLNPAHVDMMLAELDRINLIVGEFLILAKPQATRFEVKDIRFILGDVMSLLDSQAHLYGIIFEHDFTPTPCYIPCEENQLKQVFINIFKNAMEAMPKGGVIHIKAGLGASGDAVITIADEGCGIPDEMIPKLGDPFVTGKEAGTGLGIMISQRIIQSHRGTMDITSQVNVGTTVIITLPCSSMETEDAELPGANESVQISS